MESHDDDNAFPEQTLEQKDLGTLCEATCRICLMDFEVSDVIVRLPCLHIYHRACIQTWFDFERTCPQDKLRV